MLQSTALFFLRLVLISVLSGMTLQLTQAKDLDFTTNSPCDSDIQEYEINFDNVGALEWIVEGGQIISLDGRDFPVTPQELGSAYFNSKNYFTFNGKNVVFDWNLTYDFTRIKFDGSNRIEIKCQVYMPGYGNFDFDGRDHENLGPFGENYLKKIKVRWESPYLRKITCNGDDLGVLGPITGKSGSVTKIITQYLPIPTFTLTASKPSVTCTEGVQINGAPLDGYTFSHSWNTSSGVITNDWGSGIYIDRFTQDGIRPISITVSNVCGQSVTQTVNVNVMQPDYGPIQQNGSDVGVVAPDCRGNFYLNMPKWVSNDANYSWELPIGYLAATNSYNTTMVSGYDRRNMNGQLPSNALTDYVGKVTITGVCGVPMVKQFVVRPTLRPSIDPDIYSCSNTIQLSVNNPGGTQANNYWILSAPQGGSGSTFTNPTATGATFSASVPGDYTIAIGVTNGSCYSQLTSTLHMGSGSASSNSAGWQSGVLSDNRIRPGSNLVVGSTGNIYFSGRDGKIYYYSFNSTLAKWVINTLPNITNAIVPAHGAFTKIGIATIGTSNYLFYTDAQSVLMKIDLATFAISDGFGSTFLASDVLISGTDVYAIQKGTNVLFNAAFYPNPLMPLPAGSTLKAILPGNGIAYVANNNVYLSSYGQLTTTGDVYATSDVVYYNGYIYFAKGMKGSANLYRIPSTLSGPIEQITNTAKLSGVFTINMASGVIYYGELNTPARNNLVTVASGNYQSADIYQARLQGAHWLVNKATQGSVEVIDMFIHTPVYSGNHLYYIGAGSVGSGNYELEVWNLYYENACAPAVQRLSGDLHEAIADEEIIVYPNPFSNEVYLDLSRFSDSTGTISPINVEVTELHGKKVYSGNLIPELSAIPTADWSAGIYVVRIRYKDTYYSKKIVKLN